MTPATADTQVRDYLEAVRACLGDLDPEAREHLLSDTEASLLEADAEAGGLPPEVRLGPPERFASELRTAAGLPEMPATPAARPSLLARLAAHPALPAARALARELAPVWWVARAFAVFTFAAQLFGDDWSIRYPVLTSALGTPLGVLLLLAALAGSIALGRRERTAVRRWPLVLNLACVLAAAWVAFTMAGNAGAATGAVVYVDASSAPLPDGLVYSGRPIGNVYPYDRRGRLLQDVRLYDDLGQPLEVRPGEGKPRRVVTQRDGKKAFNTFPIRYFEKGTRRVGRPGLGALSDEPARIVTKPLHVAK